MDPNELSARLEHLSAPGSSNRLLDRGLARGMIWREGNLPEGSPAFGSQLTRDLLAHGYGVLTLGLMHLDANGSSELTDRAFLHAAEAIESGVRRGPTTPEHGFHTMVAASAFHLAHYSARAFCMIPKFHHDLNLSPPELVLHRLMRRSFGALRTELSGRLGLTVEGHVGPTPTEDGVPDLEATLAGALAHPILRAAGYFEFALVTGDVRLVGSAERLSRKAQALAGELGFPTIWWTARLLNRLATELWRSSMHHLIPDTLEAGVDAGSNQRWVTLRRQYIGVLLSKDTAEVELWPAQVEAARRAVDLTDDLVVALPTSAGKTRIAELCILAALATSRRVVYVTPLRALSAQIERGLNETFGPLGIRVSSMYGASGVSVMDVDVLRDSDVVVATPEKLDFSIRQDPTILDDVGLVVLDEGHMIGEGKREVRYEVLVQRLLRRPDAKRRRVVALSAAFTIGETFDEFAAWLRADAKGAPIHSSWRPTRQRTGVLDWSSKRGRGRLEFRLGEEEPFVPGWLVVEEPRGRRRLPFPKDKSELTVATAKRLCEDGHQTLVYAPERRQVESLGRKCIKLAHQGYLDFDVRDSSLEMAISVGIEWLGAEHPAVRCLRLGVALHHGRLPRTFLRELERLVNTGVLKLVIASPTIAQGLNLSCSALVFHSLKRGMSDISPSEFWNVVGRVGRAFVDLDGIVILPRFDRGRVESNRRALFEQLRAAEDRTQLISGLQLLVGKVIAQLSTLLDVDREEFAEYVLNQSEVWGHVDESSDPTQETLSEALDDLDVAILGTIEDHTVDPAGLAGALDRALAGSLWERQLHRVGDAAERYRNTLTSRAAWLWSTTSPEQRQGFYWAGVGANAGKELHACLESAVELLVRCEEGLTNENLDAAVEAISEFASTIFSIYPFVPSTLPPEWPRLLSDWLLGQPAGRSVSMTDSDESAFVQEGIVYRLVWALEAVRSLALAVGIPSANDVSGAAALCLTHGVPSWPAARLLRTGLRSRSLALRLVAQFPGEIETALELAEWVTVVQASDRLGEVLADENDVRLWEDFIAERTRDQGNPWVERTITIKQLEWSVSAPRPGTVLRIEADADARSLILRRPDFSLVGRVADSKHRISAQTTFAKVTEAGGVDVYTFGPR